MKLIIEINGDLSQEELASLAEATRHDSMMHRARLEWTTPLDDGFGSSRVHARRITAAGTGTRLTGDDLLVIARLLDDEQAHRYRDSYTWGPAGTDRNNWLSRVGRAGRKIAALRETRRACWAATPEREDARS
jgi:hypothetical protein